jgi:tetratricopeptide (TPR) repeat protein
VGLNSGEVVVRAIDSSLHMDYTAGGQTTHLAARMEQMAKPGSVLTEALPLLEEAEQSGAALGTMGGQSLWVGYLSEAYLLAGRMQEAVQRAGRALDLARAHKERGHEAWALRLLGEIAAHQDTPEIEPAEHHYRQALALAEELGMRPLQAHCHLGLGMLYAKTDQREPARANLSTAIAMYRAMDMAFRLPQADVALAQVEER